MPSRVFLARPHSGSVVPQSERSATHAMDEKYGMLTIGSSPACSLLALAFNSCVAACRNGKYDYFALLHSDVAADADWIGTLIDDINSVGADIIHAPCAMKDSRGLTSTVLSANTTWRTLRNMSLEELRDMPRVFTSEDTDGEILLPNTGCLLMRCNTWFMEEWRGFWMNDWIEKVDGIWKGKVISEDYMLGMDAYNAGQIVACSRNVETLHFDGNTSYPVKTRTSKEELCPT